MNLPIILVMCMLVLPIAGQVPSSPKGIDVLEEGLVVTGDVSISPTRSDKQEVVFQIDDPSADFRMILRGDFEEAFPTPGAPNNSPIVARSFRRLLQQATRGLLVTMRFAQVNRDIPKGTLVDEESFGLTCLVELADPDSIFALRCVDERHRDELTRKRVTVVGTVMMQKGSALDKYLRSKPVTLIRFER